MLYHITVEQGYSNFFVGGTNSCLTIYVRHKVMVGEGLWGGFGGTPHRICLYYFSEITRFKALFYINLVICTDHSTL